MIMEENKLRISFEEVSERFAKDNPALFPNKSNVGRYAKKQGYIMVKQMVNRQLLYFYIKPQNQ